MLATMLEVKIIPSMTEVDRDEWDTLVGDGSPFLEWDWLACLEEARCVTSRSGWQPQHLTVYDGGRLIAACPLYLKGHSMGEFVFDHSWAEAAHRVGVEYYPKLLVAPPFTPATGVRLLTAPEGDRPALIRLLGQTLQEVCKQNDLSSLHVNFCLADEAEVLAEIGYLKRVGLQYQWLNHGYRTFNVQKRGVFYGRYWGAFKELRHLHFNVCYYAAIDHCIKHGLMRFEPGAGGDFKRLRGFDPQPTVSMHFLADPRLAAAVAKFLDREREQVHRTIDWLQQESELKREE